MHSLLFTKMKEAALSVVPVSLICFILTLIPHFEFDLKQVLTFAGSSVVLIIGISLFTLGSEMAMETMGDKIGSSLMKTNKIFLIIIVCFIMGLLITVAEPDLSVLAEQVSNVFNSKNIIIYFVGIGVGLFLVVAVLKIIFKKDLSLMLMLFYLLAFALTAIVISNGNGHLIPLSFDSGGVTTGPITVPFLMALGVGIAATIGGRDQKENSFGLIALCSIGPIIAILLLALNANEGTVSIDTDYAFSASLWANIGSTLLLTSKEVLLALGLIVLVFLIINFIFIKLSRKKLYQIGIGIIYTFLGLVLFLSAAHIGFMPTGFKIGEGLARLGETALPIFGLVIGVVVVLAEPAILVLTKQVEEITTGGVSKKAMLIALAIGVGISICLSMIRIIFKFSVLYFLVPGYLIALGLSLFVPKMYTAIAFDSGGVASGPLTSSFILPLAIGASLTLNGQDGLLENAFGIVAMVAMTPLIAIQVLGFKDIVKHAMQRRIRTKKLISADDEQIIEF